MSAGHHAWLDWMASDRDACRHCGEPVPVGRWGWCTTACYVADNGEEAW